MNVQIVQILSELLNEEILLYIRKCCSSKTTVVAPSPWTRFENLLHWYIIHTSRYAVSTCVVYLFVDMCNLTSWVKVVEDCHLICFFDTKGSFTYSDFFLIRRTKFYLVYIMCKLSSCSFFHRKVQPPIMDCCITWHCR